ncbi:vacuolar ATP synthase [Blastocystis sp. subtype 4]|uniref:vacuolar ATP synthase n=1 Tax=Blastocystis sp. subtype 4 TaxID=944170 RepID=UPI0007116DFA|nr:vacuolar ATP synthase [Blastocystis sp. subtype 4]KNB46809.1 vacuolar ATP synthase [Blastocystis sp. subtype 4]|eukprot:XP_014530252.1 vacuolar ATP synthase [Blastocystis sp. subtype 4]
MSGAGYSGIEKLKKAEEEAAAIEQEAKQMRMSAMSEARVKAKEEIDSYRAELEAAFQQKKEAATGAGSKKEVEELSAETDKQIEALNKDYEENYEKMMNLIVDSVLNVNPRISDKKKRAH